MRCAREVVDQQGVGHLATQEPRNPVEADFKLFLIHYIKTGLYNRWDFQRCTMLTSQQHPVWVKSLKGSFTIFLFLVRSHILNSNGMWYSWFCPEGSINGQNSTFLGFHFVPRDLDSRRNKGPGLTAQGTWTRGAGDLDSRRHGTLTQINGAASRGPWGQNENPKMLSFGRL